ncbi:tyrosine-protein phosphatase non-receptor type 13 isoform X2 [Pseudoliparis swirei]|uniref:tyrosine-protein phosphatase non-receptor type 13 isoform X2 n=1 Tax=Pseudoliparis swirei TaxID=2059687 RepID=UPI0024BD8A9C|nr:tyrosine-protein phosphatase non-receptor type 13 isoform X2 [Pseudoliparis swirei]
MGTFVTLAEVLEGRGSKLDEDEVWCLLLATTDALLAISKKGSGNMCSVLSPGSVLLSANGSLAFKSCARYEDVASFTAPEIQQGQAASSRTAAEKMVVYSLGMTLYWCVDYHLPQNQPVQLSAQLEGLLLSMCEDMVIRRTDLLTVQETCELHHKALMLPPADRLVRQLVEDVYRNSVDHVSMAENGSRLTDRSQMIRDRLHRGSFNNSSWAQNKKIPRKFSGASYPEPSAIPSGCHHREKYGSWQQLHPCSPYTGGSRKTVSRSTMNLSDRKAKDAGPEFIRILDEPLVVLELPASIVSKKGKSPTTQRELSVSMPNGQSILVKCEVKTRGGDVFDMIVAHFNLVEHFYFGLAFIDDNEFFFVDNDTKISKVAPDSWKKVPTNPFVLFFRVKLFVNDISLLQRQTRHQHYLQLRRDLLEDRLSCHEETALHLGALALQTECGECMPELYGRNYYRPDQYVSKSVMERRALPHIQGELLRLHANNAQMLADESELEFLKACQQLPEYGVMFHRAIREKKPLEGEVTLGVCAKGVIVFEVKDGCRSTSQTFYWREAATISSNRRKFVVESRVSKKKHIFIAERSKIAKYLCNLCSAQHKFNNEMSSRQLGHNLVSEENVARYATACRARGGRLKSFSCSETPQDSSGLTTPQDGSLNKLCDDVTARIEARIKQQLLTEPSQRSSTGIRSPACSLRSGSEAPSGSSAAKGSSTKLESSPEREVLCVNLKKDPKLGLGVVIVGEDTVGDYDLGIFVESIVPDGPADKDGRIQTGGRLISLNHISLEGVTFSKAAEVMQSSPEEVQLIVSQPKVALGPSNVRSPVQRHYESQTTETTMADIRSPDDSLEEIVSVAMTPKTGNRLHVPREACFLGAQDSLSVPLNCTRPEEITVELRKTSGSLGISFSGGVDTILPNGGIYIRSLVPGGAAERDGRMRSGDRLLEVDGVSFQSFSYRQAVERLRNTGERVTLVVERVLVNLPRGSETLSSVSNQSISPAASPAASLLRFNSCSPVSTASSVTSDRPRDYSFVTDDNTQEVTLTKSANGLGFSFLMCELDPPTPDFSSLVRVKQLYPGQPAQRSGRIQEGDVLLAIDGQSLKELPYSVCAAFNSLICLYSLCFHLLGVIDQFDTLSISILINCKLLKGKLSFSLFHVGHISVYFQIIF